MPSPYGPRQQGQGVVYSPVSPDNFDHSMSTPHNQYSYPQYFQRQQYPPDAGATPYDEPTPALAADTYSPEYSMEDMRKPVTPSNRYSMSSTPRDFADPDAGWTEKRASGVPMASTYAIDDPVRHRRKKIWTIFGAVVAVVLIVGVVVGIVVAKHRSNHDDAAQTSSGSSGNVLSGDPSKFEKNAALHNSFWGMCYTPFGAQYEYGCGVNLSSVVEDVQILSQLTTRVRLYGSDCNVTALVLDAIQLTTTNLTIWPAIYLDQSDPGNAAWNRQVANITFALDNYGTDHIGGISVGNEYLLDGGSAANLLAYVQQFRTLASSKQWTMPIGTADAGSMFTATVAVGVDYFMANVHAWFAGTLVQDGPGWTWQYFEQNDASVAAAAPNKPQAYIAETGWPSGANDTQAMTSSMRMDR